jgi:hypothetical protein
MGRVVLAHIDESPQQIVPRKGYGVLLIGTLT